MLNTSQCLPSSPKPHLSHTALPLQQAEHARKALTRRAVRGARRADAARARQRVGRPLHSNRHKGRARRTASPKHCCHLPKTLPSPCKVKMQSTPMPHPPVRGCQSAAGRCRGGAWGCWSGRRRQAWRMVSGAAQPAAAVAAAVGQHALAVQLRPGCAGWLQALGGLPGAGPDGS